MVNRLDTGCERADFNEINDRLGPFLNIERQRDLAAIDYHRWGVVDLLQEREVVSDLPEYEQRLNSVTVDEETLSRVVEFLKRNGRESLKVVFSPGALGVGEYYKKLFVDLGLVAPDLLNQFIRHLGLVDGAQADPSLSFVPTAKEFQPTGRVEDITKGLAGTGMKTCDPVTEWLFWRRDLDKNLRRLLHELQNGGMSGLYPNFRKIADWFQFAGKPSRSAPSGLTFPKWNELSSDDYKKWCLLYLQAAGPLGLPVMNKGIYSQYPDFEHKESGLVLGTGVVERILLNRMVPFLAHISGRGKSRLDMTNWVDTAVPEPVFLAPDRSDPWVRTRLVF